MIEFPKYFPDIRVVLEMAPEEVAAKILFFLKNRSPHGMPPMTIRSNEEEGAFSQTYNGSSKYEINHKHDFILAFTEAWSWLEAQGLLVPAAGINGSNGYRVLSRRARQFQSEVDLSRFASARLLPREALHPQIAQTVWSAFMRGEYDVAVFQAMKGVEIAVREASGFGDGILGTELVRRAFNPEDGPLTDKDAQKAEREARANLFAGAIGSYKNPHSHRDVHIDDPMEALEVVLLANHLLRIVDARKAARDLQ